MSDPRGVRDAPPAEASAPPPAAVPEGVNRLLVVDDNQATCDFISRVARSSGYEVRAVHSVPDFMQVFDDVAPTLCLLDLQLEGHDGVELITYLAERGLRVPVAVMSGFDCRVLDGVGRLAKRLDLDLVGLFQKPLALADLRRMFDQQRRVEPVDPVRALDEAIDLGHIVPHYQPKLDLQSGALMGTEALARWEHPTRGLVSPMEFIPLAEEHGLIDKLTWAILERALRDQADWEEAGLPLTVAVNVSLKSIGRELANDVVAAMIRNGTKPERLILEVTESAAMTDPSVTLEVFTRLRLKHIGLAIDDFGTGYSNLVMLQQMPFSEMKIDRSFTSEILTNSGSHSIVRAIIELGHALGMKVVAEGVSSQPIYDRIREMGADIAQGFHIAKPLSRPALEAWFDQRVTEG